MTLDDAISMEPVKEKLRNLSQYMPGEEQVIYAFGTFLADRLNPELVPEDFNLTAQLTLCDMQKGIDGYSGKPIRSGMLTGYPSVIYRLLELRISDIADAVCPQDFAKDVRKCCEAIEAELRK